VVPDFLEQLGQLLDIFSRQTLLRMRAISLLFIYDSADAAPQRPAVRIIDVARAKILAPTSRPDAAPSPSPAILLPPPSLATASQNPPEHGGLIVRPASAAGNLSPSLDGSSSSSSTLAVLPASMDNVDHFFAFGLENCLKLLRAIHDKFVNRHAVFLCRYGQDGGGSSAIGSADALGVQGLQQAYDMAARLKHERISVIISAPNRRAIQTARLLAEQLNIKYVVEPAMADVQDPAVLAVWKFSTPPPPVQQPQQSPEKPDPFQDKDYVPAVPSSEPPPTSLPGL
jgi:hypothetical protein